MPVDQQEEKSNQKKKKQTLFSHMVEFFEKFGLFLLLFSHHPQFFHTHNKNFHFL